MNVDPYLSRNPLILELGCGAGKKHPVAVGVDLLDVAGVDIVGDALEALGAFPDGSVDSIYSEHFMEHVSEPRQILGSWYLSGAAPRLEARGLDMLLVPNAVS